MVVLVKLLYKNEIIGVVFKNQKTEYLKKQGERFRQFKITGCRKSKELHK